MKRIGRLLFPLLEYGLGMVFMYVGYLEFTASVLTGTTLHLVLGGELALVIYGTWFAALGVLLIAANIFRWTRVRKVTLLAMYLTTIYMTILNVVLFGFMAAIIDDVVITVWAAALWLRLTLKSDYVRIKDI